MCLFRFGDGKVYDHSSASNYIKKKGRRYMGKERKKEREWHSHYPPYLPFTSAIPDRAWNQQWARVLLRNMCRQSCESHLSSRWLHIVQESGLKLTEAFAFCPPGELHQSHEKACTAPRHQVCARVALMRSSCRSTSWQGMETTKKPLSQTQT